MDSKEPMESGWTAIPPDLWKIQIQYGIRLEEKKCPRLCFNQVFSNSLEMLPSEFQDISVISFLNLRDIFKHNIRENLGLEFLDEMAEKLCLL